MKQIIASFIIGVLLLTQCKAVYADNDTAVQAITDAAHRVDDLGNQLDRLYKDVGTELKINYIYVKLLHLLAGGKSLYADKNPNIYSEITVNSIEGPFDIKGIKQDYSQEAPWAYCPDSTVQRPNKYYLPDAAYNVTASIVKLMNQRYYTDRGSMQPYFSALKRDVMTNVLFCEAIMEYTGSTDVAVNNFYTIYEKIMYDKAKNENVIETNEGGTFKIKDKFKTIFANNGISNEKELSRLALILSFDKNLAASNNPDDVKDSYVFPYKIGYKSRENMMVAAMSLVGKVRYVWGGGHLNTGNIEGINPTWKMFSDAYPTDPGKEGYNTCVKPTNGWSPIDESAVVSSAQQYKDSRKDLLDSPTLDDKFNKLLDNSVDFSKGVPSIRLDGLDCSGYASWLYNQIDSSRKYDSAAINFISSGGLNVIPYGSQMLPGDIFSWGDHIIVVVGKVENGSNAYVMLEESPNVVKFGVIYYENASGQNINEGIAIAKEANNLLGNVITDERTNSYCMDYLGYSTITSSETVNGVATDVQKTTRYAQIGRLMADFIDENTALSDYNKKIKDMTAKEIIQHTINRLPEKYLNGLNKYSGTIFTVNKAKLTTEDSTTKEEKIDKVANSETVQKLVDIKTKL